MLLTLAAVMMTATGSGQTASRSADPPAGNIVFVCEHGSVKSLIAMQLFNKMASERGLSIRAVSRGITPDPSVPAAIAAHLKNDGLAPESFTPQAFSKADLVRAERVIAIGLDPASITGRSAVPVETWNDIPAASVDYAASRDALRKQIEPMLKKLAPKTVPATPARK